MDKLKYIKLENEDGSYSSSIPLAVDSDHVDIVGTQGNLTEELNKKALKTELESVTTNLETQIHSIASGSPAGVYSTVAELIATNPDHSKIYVVSADGHWYYYNNNQWNDGGVYQATEVEDESILYNKLNDSTKEQIKYLTIDNAKQRIEEAIISVAISNSRVNYPITEELPVELYTSYYARYNFLTFTGECDSYVIYIREFDDNGNVVSTHNMNDNTYPYFAPKNNATTIRCYISVNKCTVAGTVELRDFRILTANNRKEYTFSEDVERHDIKNSYLIDKYGFKNYVVEEVAEASYNISIATNRGQIIIDKIDINNFETRDVYAYLDSFDTNITGSVELFIRINEFDNTGETLVRNVISYKKGDKSLHFKANDKTSFLRVYIHYSNYDEVGTATIKNLRICSKEYPVELLTDVYNEDIDELKNKTNELDFSMNVINDSVKGLAITGAAGGSKSFFKSQLPDYWKDDGDSNLYINDKIRDINKISADTRFTWITDQHWESNTKHSIDLIGYVNAACQIENTLNGGDIMCDVKSSTTFEKAEYHMHVCMDEWFDKIPYNHYFTFGNHDLNRTNPPANMSNEDYLACCLSYEVVYNACIKPWNIKMHFTDNPDWVEGTELWYWNRLHYYFDDEKAKIRFICINTGTSHNPLNATVSSANKEIYRQLTWLYDTLMSMEDGWSYIVYGHEFFKNGETGNYQSWAWFDHSTPIAQLMLGAKNKTIVTPGGDSNQYDYVKSLYDFTNAPDITPICMLCGHQHVDFSMIFDETTLTAENGNEVQNEHQLLAICSTCDTKGSVHIYEMTPGTLTEQAFDVVSIDKENKKILMTRIGVGYDREFYY